MHNRRPRITYANVASTLALFLAVAGGTTAVALSGRNNVDANDIQKGAVAGREVKNSSLFAKDLGKGAVSASELQGSSVTGGKIKDESVWSRELGAGAVTAPDIHDDAVDGGSVIDGSLSGADVLNRSIGEPDLAAVPGVRVTSDDFPAPDGIGVPVVFDSDTAPGTFDPLNMWRPATPARLVAPVAGMYVATGEVGWDIDDSAAAGGLFDIGEREVKLESSRAQNWVEVTDAKRTANWEQMQVITGVLNLEQGDEVRMSVTQQNEDASTVDVFNVDLALTWVGPSPGPVATP